MTVKPRTSVCTGHLAAIKSTDQVMRAELGTVERPVAAYCKVQWRTISICRSGTHTEAANWSYLNILRLEARIRVFCACSDRSALRVSGQQGHKAHVASNTSVFLLSLHYFRNHCTSFIMEPHGEKILGPQRLTWLMTSVAFLILYTAEGVVLQNRPRFPPFGFLITINKLSTWSALLLLIREVLGLILG